MAFLTSNETFESVFGDIPEKTPAASFLDDIGRYLRKKDAVPGAKTLGKWIASGNELAVFTCREDIVKPLAEEMLDREIPYVVVTTKEGRMGFLVMEPDQQKAEEAKEAVLKRKSKTCTIVSGKEMMRQASQDNGNKACLVIHNLTAEESQIMQEKFASYFDAAKIGVDRMRGKRAYAITVFAKNSIKQTAQDGIDICRIFLETAMAVGGPNGMKNKAYAALKNNFRERLAKNFHEEGVNLNKTPLWIVGTGTQYIKVTGNGFVYGHVIKGKTNPKFISEYQADIAQPDYRQLLVSFCERITDKMTTYSATEAQKHFKTVLDSEDNDYLDITPTAAYRVWNKGEKLLAAQIDTMLSRKMQGDEIMTMQGRWNEKFEHYMKEAAQFLNALTMGRVPTGFDPDDLRELKFIMHKYKLEGEMYEQAVVELNQAEALTITNTIERIADVNERIGSEREQIEARKEREREEKAMARGSRGRGGRSSGPAREE